MSGNTLSRTLNDVGLAAWFGGTLANAVALNPAAGEADSPVRVGSVANTGWDRWTPVNAAAIGAHLVGSTGLLLGNKGRVLSQRGVAAYSRMLGRRVSDNTHVPAESGTEPSARTPRDVAEAQRKLRLLQWAVPALTAAMIVTDARLGEQQRVSQVLDGITGRIPGLSG
jgi:hypothetical protein